MTTNEPLPSDWVEVIVTVPARVADEVAALFVADVPQARAGVEVRGDEIVYWVHADEVALAVEEARAALMRWDFQDGDAANVRWQAAVPESEWRDAWKRYFHVTRVTRQLVVVPSWERESFQPAAADLVIDLDPGMAFGTGTHASTRLLLEELQRFADDGRTVDRVVDVGAGSGILAIAACRLWPAARVVAIDNDPLAVGACSDNAANNRLADRIDSQLDGLGAAAPVPLVLANIQAHVIRDLAAELIRACAPGGSLMLSGILTGQAQALADDVVAAGAAMGVSLQLAASRPSADGQWTALILVRGQ